MKVPDVITAKTIPTGADEPHGIIHKIRNIANDDAFSYVSATAQAKEIGDEEALINWSGPLVSRSEQGSYIQIEFKKGYVFPTFYSLRGKYASYSITKEWVLYGLNAADETPKEIASNTSVGSTFCHPYYEDYKCGNDNWGTFAVHNATKAYKYFRIIGKKPLYTGFYRVELTGIELFGIYSKDGRTSYHFKTYPIARHDPLYHATCFCLIVLLIE